VLVQARSILPLISTALWVSVATGLLLLPAYPTRALTNLVFHAKLAAIVSAVLTWRIVAFGLGRPPDHTGIARVRKRTAATAPRSPPAPGTTQSLHTIAYA